MPPPGPEGEPKSKFRVKLVLKIVGFSVLGVVLLPIIAIIGAAAKGESMAVRNLLMEHRFKLQKTWFFIQALVAKLWFNWSPDVLLWYGNNCFINSVFESLATFERYDLYKQIAGMTPEVFAQKIEQSVGNDNGKFASYKAAWDAKSTAAKASEAKRIIKIAKALAAYIKLKYNTEDKDVDTSPYIVNGQFSIVGKFNFWQFNEKEGSYKFKENELLGKEFRDDYKYGSISMAFEAFGGGHDIESLNNKEEECKEEIIDMESLNNEKKEKKEQPKDIIFNSNKSLNSNDEERKETIKEVVNDSNDENKISSNNDAPENDNSFEEINNIEINEAKENALKNTAIPYFEILDEALKNEEEKQQQQQQQPPSTIYKTATVSFDEGKGLQINFANKIASGGNVSVKPKKVLKNIFVKEINGQKYYLTSISSGKNSGAFNIDIVYNYYDNDGEKCLVNYLVVNDCHGGYGKLIKGKNPVNELYKFLNWKKGMPDNTPVLLRYTNDARMNLVLTSKKLHEKIKTLKNNEKIDLSNFSFDHGNLNNN